MIEENQKNLISQKETLADVIESLFSVKESGVWTVFKVVLGIASIGWLADSILPFLQGGSVYVWTGNIPDELNLRDSLHKLTFPLVWFVFFVGVLFFFRHNKLKALQYEIQGSFPHRGLIVSLSPLAEKIKLKELEEQIDNKTLDIEEFYNKSNWGQLAFTIAHHSNLLQRCWICTTSKSTDQFSVAQKLVNFVSQNFDGREVECIEVKIEDENDISLMAAEVSKIYRNLGGIENKLQPIDVVSNYTGGTSAMTGGIIMATLNENREIEYINQKYLRNLSSDLLRNIDQNLAIVTSKTNLVITEKLN